MTIAKPTDFACRLTSFLTEYLPSQRGLSPNTIKSYRDAFVLLLRYCREVCEMRIERLSLEAIDASLIVKFLGHLEKERGSSTRTRNHRLAAFHSFFKYVQVEEPDRIQHCQRILAIPLRRIAQTEPTYLSVEELAAILRQPDSTTPQGRRDALMLSLLYDTGARVQELIDLSIADLRLASPPQVRLTGKGRKIRVVPLMKGTAANLGEYVKEHALDRPEQANEPLFVNRAGNRLSRWGIRHLLSKYSEAARVECPTLPQKITPHTLRHTKAMHLLQSGNPAVVIRDFLGHSDIQSTQIYAKADLDMKRRALEKANQLPESKKDRSWQRDPDLLTWLGSL